MDSAVEDLRSESHKWRRFRGYISPDFLPGNSLQSDTE